jgi:hypothetical protein
MEAILFLVLLRPLAAAAAPARIAALANWAAPAAAVHDQMAHLAGPLQPVKDLQVEEVHFQAFLTDQAAVAGQPLLAPLDC